MSKIQARIKNYRDGHEVSLHTNDQSLTLEIPSKPGGFGSLANGGELLFLALATCYCNDISSVAARRATSVTALGSKQMPAVMRSWT